MPPIHQPAKQAELSAISIRSDKKYDLILCISTLEHVGWDENPRDADKTLKAVEQIRNLLADNGIAFITLPVGYNDDLIKHLENGRLRFTEQYYMKRITKEQWVQCKKEELKDVKYNSPYGCANGLIIGFIKK